MSKYTILSFDPGLSTLGWASGTYDMNTRIYTVHRFGNFKATKAANREKAQTAVYGHRLIALNLLEDEIRRLIEFFNPEYIASEDIFLHMKHINAFAALTLCLHAMRKAAFMKNKTIHTMSPCDIKKDNTGMGHADKDAIQNAILKNPHIVIEDNKLCPIDKMCEHEADSIAVGYAFTQSLLPELVLNDNLLGDIQEIEKTKKENKSKERALRREMKNAKKAKEVAEARFRAEEILKEQKDNKNVKKVYSKIDKSKK